MITAVFERYQTKYKTGLIQNLRNIENMGVEAYQTSYRGGSAICC